MKDKKIYLLAAFIWFEKYPLIFSFEDTLFK